jgi:uncharacterized membrane protein YfcA
MTFTVIIAVVSVLAGAIASVAGFGIGSLLTPLLAVATAGVLFGAAAGERALKRVPEPLFRRVVSLRRSTSSRNSSEREN